MCTNLHTKPSCSSHCSHCHCHRHCLPQLCGSLKSKGVSLTHPVSEWVIRSPIDLSWTAKNKKSLTSLTDSLQVDMLVCYSRYIYCKATWTIHVLDRPHFQFFNPSCIIMIILVINLLINSIRVITLGITDSSARSAVSNITLTGGKVAVALGPSIKKHHLDIPHPFNLVFTFSRFLELKEIATHVFLWQDGDI